MEAREAGGRIDVRILASEDACADCLVPKTIMHGILGQVLGVAEDVIDLTYPRRGSPGPHDLRPDPGPDQSQGVQI